MRERETQWEIDFIESPPLPFSHSSLPDLTCSLTFTPPQML